MTHTEEGTGTTTPETGTTTPNSPQSPDAAGTGTHTPETGTITPNPLPLRFSLDMGQGRFVVVDGPGPTSKVKEFRTIVDVMKWIKKNSVLVAEATLGSFGFEFKDYNAAIALAAKKGIELRAVPIRAVKNLRMDRGHESTKNNKKNTANDRRKEDILEARLLWEIGFIQPNRVFKSFTPRVPRVVDTASLAVRRAMDGKYKWEAAWLKAHGFDGTDNLLQRVRAVAVFVHSVGGTRATFDKACGWSEFGTGIVRAQACYHKRLRARLSKAGLENSTSNRSIVLRALRKLSRLIFHMSHPQVESLQEGTGTPTPETGTPTPNSPARRPRTRKVPTCKTDTFTHLRESSKESSEPEAASPIAASQT